MRRNTIVIIFLGVLLLFAVPSPGAQVLRISAIPDEAPSELIRKFKPLAEYLENALGMEVKFIPLVDYAATVEALAAGKLDLVWYGGFTHVQARLRTRGGVRPLVMRIRDARFKSKFIARKGSGIKTLQDLKGKTFSFGSVSSTSGHLMPRFFLKKAGLYPDQDFKKFSFSGAHDATAKWVEAGKVDAGALNEAVWERLVRDKKIDTGKVGAFYTTPGYVDYNWTIRGGLDRRLMSKLTQAFLRLDPKDPKDKEILDLQRAKGYVLALPEDFNGIEAAAREAGLLNKSEN